MTEEQVLRADGPALATDGGRAKGDHGAAPERRGSENFVGSLSLFPLFLLLFRFLFLFLSLTLLISLSLSVSVGLHMNGSSQS